jgi:drug/metabolite transporter (DMT)-like permease
MTARILASEAAAPNPSLPSAGAVASPAPDLRVADGRPMWGIALMVMSTVFFACGDVITKVLAGSVPPIEIVWLRYVTFSVILIPLAWRGMRGGRLRSRRPGLQALRGLGMVGSALFFTVGLPYLPVADATAIYFISPILITALAIPFLGEKVGWRRWTAALVGLVGVLIVIRPGTGAFNVAALLPLLGATCWAGAAVATRMMSGTDRTTTTLVYSALVGLTVLTALVPFSWRTPNATELALALAMGAASTAGHGLVVLAYRHASASMVAPYSYVQLIWAGSLGYAVFGSLPDAYTVTGAGIIAASGLYTAYRERVRAAARA